MRTVPLFALFIHRVRFFSVFLTVYPSDARTCVCFSSVLRRINSPSLLISSSTFEVAGINAKRKTRFFSVRFSRARAYRGGFTGRTPFNRPSGGAQASSGDSVFTGRTPDEYRTNSTQWDRYTEFVCSSGIRPVLPDDI